MEPDSGTRHQQTRTLRFGTVAMAGVFVLGSVLFGLVVHSTFFGLLGVSLAALSFNLAALMMSDGTALPRARPMERWERQGLTGFLSVTVLLAIAILVDYAVTDKHAAVQLLVAGGVVALGGGIFAMFALLRA